MASTKGNLKRKASVVEANDSTATTKPTQAADPDDFGDAILNAVFDDDDDSEDEFVDDDDQDDDESDLEDELSSDDIPTDDEEGVEDKSALTDGATVEDQDEDDRPNYRIEKDANGGVRYVYDEIDPVYDSDDSDAQGPTNTVRLS